MSDSNRPVGNCKHGFRHGLSCDACILQRRVDELHADIEIYRRWLREADQAWYAKLSAADEEVRRLTEELATANTKIDEMNISSRRNHGASGLCCQLREFERDRAIALQAKLGQAEILNTSLQANLANYRTAAEVEARCADEAREELTAAKRDAERYRWLRESKYIPFVSEFIDRVCEEALNPEGTPS